MKHSTKVKILGFLDEILLRLFILIVAWVAWVGLFFSVTYKILFSEIKSDNKDNEN